jgi:mannitol-1-phosphate/altronate dehydrogenase
MNDEAQIVELYTKAQIIGISLPEQAIRSQAKTIAKGLLERHDKGGKSLTLLIVMNRIDAAKFVKIQVEKALRTLTDEEKAKKIIQSTFFSETVANRIVSKISDEIIVSSLQNEMNQIHKNILKYSEKMKAIFELSHSHFEGNLINRDKIIPNETNDFVDYLSSVSQFSNELLKFNVTVFSSEPDMPLYARKGSPVLERLRQIVTVEDIKSMQEIKNKLSNGTHAVIAWYSALLGYKTVGQGMGDSRVSNLAEHIIKHEVGPALLIENLDSKQYISSITSNFLARCRASFKDECARVGRDPLRKLQQNERVIGTIKIAQKHGVDTTGLEFGVACAIMYSLLPNQTDLEALKIKEIYEKRCKTEDVLTFAGDYNKSKYVCLDKQKDAELLRRIQESFENLKKDLASINF